VAGSEREPASVGILYDWESWWASEQDSHPTALLDYRQEALDWYSALLALGVRADLVTTRADLSRHQVLVAPVLHVVPAELAKDPMLKAWSVSEWLSKEGTYSLKSKHASATDPTAHFLFGDKVGYCVHFAHAATYLMRALGVPARVATGYAVEESARQGGSAILVSSGAAHALSGSSFNCVSAAAMRAARASSAAIVAGSPPESLSCLMRFASAFCFASSAALISSTARARTCQTTLLRVHVSGPPSATSRNVASSTYVTWRSQTSRKIQKRSSFGVAERRNASSGSPPSPLASGAGGV
jgi:hypothetical protein